MADVLWLPRQEGMLTVHTQEQDFPKTRACGSRGAGCGHDVSQEPLELWRMLLGGRLSSVVPLSITSATELEDREKWGLWRETRCFVRSLESSWPAP